MLTVMQQRYSVLYCIDLLQPIGRRALAENTNLTERMVRSEVDFLHEQGLINVTSKGMYTTKEGTVILEQMADFMSEAMGLRVLEQQLKDTLEIANVVIVPGNSDQYSWIKQEMGKACIHFLKSIIQPNAVIAVTGGTTMAAVADVMTPLNKDGNYLFVPARGGIGEKMENEANTIVAKMASKANGNYRLLYVPDFLSENSYQSIINEPSIHEVLLHIQRANIVLHGIGEAFTMAARRKTTSVIVNKLKQNNAVSEAFGYYFNQNGQVVHKVKTVGLHLEDLASKDYVIAVAGGKSKGQAIESYFRQAKADLLITDEAAAEQILRDSSL